MLANVALVLGNSPGFFKGKIKTDKTAPESPKQGFTHPFEMGKIAIERQIMLFTY
jgi:hypothetical protein